MVRIHELWHRTGSTVGASFAIMSNLINTHGREVRNEIVSMRGNRSGNDGGGEEEYGRESGSRKRKGKLRGRVLFVACYQSEVLVTTANNDLA